MTRPGTEPRSPEPLVNTLATRHLESIPKYVETQWKKLHKTVLHILNQPLIYIYTLRPVVIVVENGHVDTVSYT